MLFLLLLNRGNGRISSLFLIVVFFFEWVIGSQVGGHDDFAKIEGDFTAFFEFGYISFRINFGW